MTVRLIKQNGDIAYYSNFFEDSPPLAWLQEKVGGHIEVIKKGNKQFIVDEEGLLKNQKPNELFPEFVGNVIELRGDHRLK